jgi:hypothetical protein
MASEIRASRWKQTLARGGAGGLIFVAAVLVFAASLHGDARARFLPQLRRGQMLQYEVRGRVNRIVKTESKISSMRGPQQLQGDLSSLVDLSIQEVRAGKAQPWISAQIELRPGAGTPNPRATTPVSKVSFNILDRGQLGDVTGLDLLSPEQQLLWRFWVARFAFGWTLPAAGMKPGEKWKYEEPELDAALIAELSWEREVTYVQDDRCPVVPADTCGVFLVQSTLRQKSSTKDSTPEDFRLHELKTSGTAHGGNQVIAYISKKTGILMRASEDVKQDMDVTVLKIDGTNGVHYDVEATSHFETLFVPPTPATPAK